MKINDVYKVKIIDDNHNGNGICKINKFPVFVKRAVLGDVVNVRITKMFKKYALGEIISFISKSSSHINSLCPYYDRCGGCSLLHVSYDREIMLKERYLKRLFGNLFYDIKFCDRFNYRNKVTFHVNDKEIGFYDELSNNLVSVSNCMLLSCDINGFIDCLKSIDLSFVKEVVVRSGDNGILVYVSGKVSSYDLEVIKNCSLVISVYVNDDLVYGDEFIVSSIGNVKYYVNHKAFFQVNSECCFYLYEEIKNNIYGDNVLDLYCGIGSIGIYLSSACKKIVGVEINEESIKCARRNIKLNDVDNYEVILGDASCVCDKFDTIVVDPPRAGLSKEVIDNINKMNSERLIYVSCNPSTLKRDISLLDNYELVSVKGFNMFPCTKHVECVSVFDLKK